MDLSTVTLSQYLKSLKAFDGTPYTIEDFFPDCVLPQCDFNTDCTVHTGVPHTTIHQHVLPKQRQVFDSVCMYTYSQGGVGSAKTVAFAARTVALSVALPHNEGAVCRLNYRDLYKSSWKDIKLTNKRLIDRGKLSGVHYSHKTQGDHSQITYPNGSILYAIQSKNWSEGLGASYGLFWVDDCMETPKELFAGDEGSAGLISRLRLPAIAYHPLVYDAIQRPHGFLSGMVSTNPPFLGHWSHDLFGKEPGIHALGDDYIEWIQVATFENPFTGLHYTKSLIAVQAKLNKSENTIRRIVHGESIPAYGGVPVFPQFDHKRHVAKLDCVPTLPLVRSWDFGHDHPGVIYAQVYTCPFKTNHFFTLAETADVFHSTVYNLYDNHVKPFTAKRFPDIKLILDCGDRAGYRASSANKDARSDMKILMYERKLPFKWKYMFLDASLQYVRGLLDKQSRCPCGLETILISPDCPVLIGALEGGYKYSKSKQGIIGKKPIEDLYFADVACAWRYGIENYQKFGIPLMDKRSLEQELLSSLAQQDVARATLTPWSWMDMSERDMATLLTS